MATLTGKITDVTGRPPDSISSITVKAPSARIGSGTDVIVSSPAEVTFDKLTGDITISGLTGGLSWLHIEGDGWSDSIPLAVAEGMITLVEAIANAAGVPGLTDFIALLTDLQTRIDDIAQGSVDVAIDTRIDAKADVSTVDDLAAVTTGITGVARRNSRRIRELMSELATKADRAELDAVLAGKADASTVDELSALAVNALGVSRRNADQIKKLATGETNPPNLDEILATKADKVDVDNLSALTTNALQELEAHDADIQTAMTTAQAAMTTASTASTTAQNVETRVAAVEAVAELSPESPVDGQTASLISQPDSLTKAAVTAAIGAAFQEDPAGSGLYTLIF